MSQEPEPAANASTRQSARGLEHFHSKRYKGRVLWSVVTALFCVAAGIVIGAGLATLYFKKTTFPRPPRSAEMAERILARVKTTVPITTDEEVKVKEIVLRHMGEVKRIRKESWGSIRGQFDDMREEVGQVLGPERKEKWIAEIEKKWPRKKPDSGKAGDNRSPHHDGEDDDRD